MSLGSSAVDTPTSRVRQRARRPLALTAFAVYSTHDVVVKFLGGTYSPIQMVFFANLFGFPIVTLMLMRDPVDGNLRPRHPWWTPLRTASAVLRRAACSMPSRSCRWRRPMR